MAVTDVQRRSTHEASRQTFIGLKWNACRPQETQTLFMPLQRVKTLFSHAEEIWLYIKRNLKYLCIFRMNDLRASSTLSLYFSASVLNVCAAFSTRICWKRLECNKACNMLSSLQLPPSAPPALAWQSHWTQSQCCQSVVVALFKNKQEISCV